jgi:hypothetical protein
MMCISLVIAVVVGICSIVITASVNKTIYIKNNGDQVMFVDQEAPPAYEQPRRVEFKNDY